MAIALLAGSPVYATESPSPSIGASIGQDAADAAERAGLALRDCEAYYYYSTKQTLCEKFDGKEDVNCSQVGSKVQLRDKTNDPWGLDNGDGDDMGCEGEGDYTPPTSKPTTPPTAAPSSEPTSAPATGTGGSEPELPVTGPSGLALAGTGLLLLGIGGAALAVRKRRTRFMP